MSRVPITLIAPGSAPVFPDPSRALTEPNGLLAAGGDLAPERLLAAYRHGIFPWFGPGEPILWWSPDPRCGFATDGIHVSRSLRRQLRRSTWVLSTDQAFEAVMRACAAPRADGHGTWITPEMVAAYVALHQLGHAHSVEVWDDTRLVGGIYGVATGHAFAGESMFSAESGGSKIALLTLARLLARDGCRWLDAQVPNPHLMSLGATLVPRVTYLARLRSATGRPGHVGSWASLLPWRRVTELLDA